MAKDREIAFKQKQLEVEMLKVDAAKADFELKILEHERNIERLKEQVANQERRVQELKEEISKLQ